MLGCVNASGGAHIFCQNGIGYTKWGAHLTFADGSTRSGKEFNTLPDDVDDGSDRYLRFTLWSVISADSGTASTTVWAYQGNYGSQNDLRWNREGNLRLTPGEPDGHDGATLHADGHVVYEGGTLDPQVAQQTHSPRCEAAKHDTCGGYERA
jgi:hypothetical protein